MAVQAAGLTRSPRHLLQRIRTTPTPPEKPKGPPAHANPPEHAGGQMGSESSGQDSAGGARAIEHSTSDNAGGGQVSSPSIQLQPEFCTIQSYHWSDGRYCSNIEDPTIGPLMQCMYAPEPIFNEADLERAIVEQDGIVYDCPCVYEALDIAIPAGYFLKCGQFPDGSETFEVVVNPVPEGNASGACLTRTLTCAFVTNPF